MENHLKVEFGAKRYDQLSRRQHVKILPSHDLVLTNFRLMDHPTMTSKDAHNSQSTII